MPGDYSRTTFNREKHYSGVLKQQGRVELDADDNEQLSIQHYRDETEAIDVIGQSGVPKKNDGFKIGIAAGADNLTISAGRYYVGGLLCELENGATYAAQPYFPNPDFTTLSSPPASPPGGREVSLDNGTYLVFLDAWKREITALDDPEIREVALGGPDTTARLQNVWQVRLLRVGPISPPQSITCKTPLPEFDQIKAAGTGKLNARTQPPEPEQSACLLPPNTGYNSLENQLYRVEVHTGGTRAQTTFKFSRDNASVETTISNIAGSVLSVADLGKDEILNFAPGQWVEIVDQESTLKSSPHPLVQIDKIGPGPNEITLKSSAAGLAGLSGLKLRRWDQTGPGANANGLNANLANWIDLESGIQVNFGAGTYRSGDYWLIPARTATGEIEWPRDTTAARNPIPQRPKGILHHYCRLALIASTGGSLSLIADCRKSFPSLTEICAEDICFDNSACDFAGAQNVQDALDMLCQSREGPCTFIAIPGRPLQPIFDAIPQGGDAEICFQVGLYELTQTVNVEGKGHIKLTGAGFGTRIVAKQVEAALRFVSCASVLVRDLYAETGIARTGTGPNEGLNGTLTVRNCGVVNIESVRLKCGSAPSRAATCITVRQDTNRGSARIQQCNLEVGHQQTGILLVNVMRSHVEDNLIRVDQAAGLKPSQLLADQQHLANLRSLLIADARLGTATSKGSRANLTLTVGNQAIQFRTDTSLKAAWTTLVRDNPPAGVNSPRALLVHVNKLANRLLLDENFRRQFPAFQTLVNAILLQDRSIASQGITVGGNEASDVRVLNNTIAGVLQGIHVGLSRREPSNEQVAGVVTIAGNTIGVLLSAVAAKRDRHGIFVGNCDSLMIKDNNLRLERLLRAERLEIDGIRVWGTLGDRALITQNHLASVDGNSKNSFDIGVRVQPLRAKGNSQLWLTNFNVAPSKQLTTRVANGAVQNNNVP
jgi:Family of unknown function (DUF6519)